MRRAVNVRRKARPTTRVQARPVMQPTVVAIVAVLAVGSSAMAFTGDTGAVSTSSTVSTLVTDQVTGSSALPPKQAQASGVEVGARAPSIRSAPNPPKSDPSATTGKLTVIVAGHEDMPAVGQAVDGMPLRAQLAYRQAASELAATGCDAPWYLLAGIGLAESNHGRVFGAVLGTNGRSTPLIRGPVLNGVGDYAAIADSDDGRLDGDLRWDRAVGPMQFIPQTWASYAADGDGDGVEDPYDLDDAAMAAGRYLCASGGDLTDPAGQRAALFSYNHSDEYVLIVSAYADAYRRGDSPSVPMAALQALSSRSGDREQPSVEAAQQAERATRPDREPKPDGTPQPGRTPKPDRTPKPAPAPQPDRGPAPRPEPRPDPRSAPKPEPEPIPKPEPKPEPNPKPEPKPEPEPDPKPDPKPEPKPEPEPEPNPEPDPEPDPKPEPKPEPDPDPDPKPEPKPRPEPDPQPEPLPDPEPEPVHEVVTSTLTGVPAACEDAWCVAGTNVGALSPWAEGSDLDGDCKAESGAAELTGLSVAGVSVIVSVQQSLVDGEVVKTSIKGFSVPQAPTCPEGEAAPGTDGEQEAPEAKE